MPTAKNSTRVRLRIVCLNPPPATCEGEPSVFGLQDKSQALVPGTLRPDGALEFDCELEARRNEADTPNFLGPYAHGTPQQRFLYLSLRHAQDDSQGWIRRIKIPLSGITWEQVEAGGVLEATIDGGRTGTVPLIGGGWLVR